MSPRSGITILSIALVLCGAVPVRAASPAASILLFPRVVVDDAEDTFIQITNVSNREAYARCSYLDASGASVARFELALEGQQSTHWVVSRGRLVDDGDPTCSRTQPDCDGAGLDPGDIPSVVSPFAGALMCVQLDRSGAPLSGNALVGRATLNAADGDVASYAALGLQGLPDNDADDVLCVDGVPNAACTVPEYSACPTEWRVLHDADGAPAPLDPAHRVVRGALTALPCALAFGGAPAASDLQITSTDEMDQTFTAAGQLAPLTTTALSDLSAVLGSATSGSARNTRLAGTAGFALLAESDRRLDGDATAPAGRAMGGVSDATDGAAVTMLPYLLVDAARGVDTIVDIANTSDQPLHARCAIEATTSVCVGGGAADSCLPGGISCSGSCETSRSTLAFGLTLEPQQPLGWRIGSGLTRAAAVELAAVEVPAMDDQSLGLLRCVAVDAVGRPVDRNALVATASVETFAATEGNSATDHVDAARYDGIGQQAVDGAVDRDAFLVLGGEAPEYVPCGTVLSLSHVFDGAMLRTGARADTVGTTLALAPCSADLGVAEPAQDVVQFLVYNEFRQRFSTSKPLAGQMVTPLSLIDTTDLTRSIFSVGVVGTLAGQTRVSSTTGGLMGVAIERHAGDDATRPYSAAVALQPEGRTAVDVVALDSGGCIGDCDGNGQVGIDELLRGVNIGLGALPLAQCGAFDNDDDGTVGVAELIQGVSASLSSCPSRVRPTLPPTPTPGPTPPILTGGPDITYFGLVSGDDQAVAPIGTDGEGRPIFAWPRGEGFGIVVEARPGLSGRQVGQSTFDPGGTGLPDLQLIADRALGDGSEAVCDADQPSAGGVPATAPFAFDAPNAVATINDLGCRFDDGTAQPRGGAAMTAACSRTGFLARASRTSFCLPVDHAWRFPSGDTVLAVRIRELGGQIGIVRQIVVRVP